MCLNGTLLYLLILLYIYESYIFHTKKLYTNYIILTKKEKVVHGNKKNLNWTS